MAEELPTIAFRSAAEWESWLEANHDSAPGVWVKIAKKASGIRGVAYPEVVEGALCFGWIDGLRRSLDETHYVQRITPRRPRSKWSEVNREKIAELTAAGRMRPAGIAEVERAKADGRWADAYPRQSTAEVPGDLRKALDASPRAAATFSSLSGQNRYAILFRLHDAKRAETRERRLAKFVAMLERGETIYD